MTCEEYLSTVGYSGSPSTVNETNCTKKKKEVTSNFIMSSTNSSQTCPTMNRLRKSAISTFAVEKLVLQLAHLTHGANGF